MQDILYNLHPTIFALISGHKQDKNVKVKLALEQATNAQKGSRRIALLFL